MLLVINDMNLQKIALSQRCHKGIPFFFCKYFVEQKYATDEKKTKMKRKS